MFKIYKDVFFWSFLMLWLIITISAWAITGGVFLSYVINLGMISIFAVIVYVRFHNDRFYNWLETPLKKKQNGKERKRLV